MAESRAHILRIPRELRDMIYIAYVREPGGYLYNPESGKLCTANRHLIHTALALSCRQVAKELRGLALEVNAVSFYPVRSTAKAFLFERVLSFLQQVKRIVLNTASHKISAEVRERIGREYTFAHELLDMMGNGSFMERPISCDLTSGRPWGIADSQHRAITDRLLEMASCSATFHDAAAHSFSYHDNLKSFTTYHSLLSLQPVLWGIPTRQLVDTLAGICPPCEGLAFACDPRTNIYFSASAAAYKFMSSLSEFLRTNIRNIQLYETRRSVAYPECHALGLVPFCVENPKLHVRREVDIFRTVFPIYGGIKNAGWDLLVTQDYVVNLQHRDVADRLVPWLEEAAALTSVGMPITSYSLVFKAPPFECQQILDVLTEAAKWQDAALAASHQGHIGPVEPVWKEDWPCLRTINFSRIVESINSPKSFIRFDNATATKWNTDAMLETAWDWTKAKWAREYESMQSQRIVFGDLPSWLDIQREYLAKDEEFPDCDHVDS